MCGAIWTLHLPLCGVFWINVNWVSVSFQGFTILCIPRCPTTQECLERRLGLRDCRHLMLRLATTECQVRALQHSDESEASGKEWLSFWFGTKPNSMEGAFQ